MGKYFLEMNWMPGKQPKQKPHLACLIMTRTRTKEGGKK